MDEKGRIIATILLPFETSIPTAFINLSLLKIIAMDKYQFYSLPIQSTVLLPLHELPKAGGNEKYVKIFERNDDAGLFK